MQKKEAKRQDWNRRFCIYVIHMVYREKIGREKKSLAAEASTIDGNQDPAA